MNAVYAQKIFEKISKKVQIVITSGLESGLGNKLTFHHISFVLCIFHNANVRFIKNYLIKERKAMERSHFCFEINFPINKPIFPSPGFITRTFSNSSNMHRIILKILK